LKTFFLDEHGCSKNQVDGEILISRLENLGMQKVIEAEDADLIVINTCGFIESAKQESISALMDARKAYPKAKILFSGCLAERYASDFKENLPEADAIFGNGDLSKIDTVIKLLDKNERPVITPPQIGVCGGERHELLNFPGSAYIKITEGCNNCCSFCAIPVIRGALRSRSANEIVDEIKALLKRGVFEFNLIGQDLAAYGRDGIKRGATGDSEYFSEPSPLKTLLEKISAIKGDFWIRLLYIHPDHFPRDIIPVIKADKRLLHYFDIPFQTGDNATILSMNRVGTAEGYEELVQTLRTQLSDSDDCATTSSAAIRTTFLCGFPGESNEAAKHTVEFMKKIQPDWSGCFTYSLEEDTVAYSMTNPVSETVATKRAEVLRKLQTSVTETRLKMHIGHTYRVLLEEIVPVKEGTEGLAIGRAWFQAPDVDGACVVRFEPETQKEVDVMIPGKTVMVKVIGVSGVDLDTVLLV
jgi:ribosomal protein S12 methylthiotransferase